MKPRPAGPVFKWAGGKRQLLPHLRRFYPPVIPGYHEPFLGSGAVFFDLCASGRLDPSRARLSDDNADLIGTYLRVRDATAAFLSFLQKFAEAHAREGKAHYYRVRDEQFNPRRRAWLQEGGNPELYPVELAAMFLYLNRTGYNGLFRLNAGGEFNVPMGRYERPRIVHPQRIQSTASTLEPATLKRATFDEALQAVKPGDLVYLDPPYAPMSRTANFRSYTAAGFSAEDQRRLRDCVIFLARRGVNVILSNSTAAEVVRLYDSPGARRAGLRCYRVPARRAINTNPTRRGVIDELVVTNCPRSPGFP